VVCSRIECRNVEEIAVSAGQSLSFGYVVLVAFWTVFVAELVGDKSIYTVASLSLRFHALIVFMAITAAFAAKSLAAVLLAQTLIRLHSHWTDLLSAVAFFFSALFIWFKEPKPRPTEHPAETRWWQPAAISFASLFFTEWGDPGQIAVAALTMKFHSPVASWLGGALAMATKGGLAITLGLKLRERLPLGLLRTVASASCCVLGIVALGAFVLR
jgi:putative Ca2+/H+ antiporter (TMEM165/GDT1 family)